MIDKNNYEIWFLDYLEDNLSTKDSLLLETFLESHPRLKEELDEMSILQIPEPQSEFFLNKELLKKDLLQNDEIGEESIIAYHEGDVSSSDQESIAFLISKNKSLQKSSTYIKSSHLSAESIVYDQKESLKQEHYNLDEVDHLMMSYLDHTISDSDKIWLEKHFSASALKNQLDSFRKVKLHADETIVYPYKANLKKSDTKVIPLGLFAKSNSRFWVSRITGIAASLLVFFFAYQLWNSPSSKIQYNDTNIVQIEKAEPSINNTINTTIEKNPIDDMVASISSPKEKTNSTINKINIVSDQKRKQYKTTYNVNHTNSTKTIAVIDNTTIDSELDYVNSSKEENISKSIKTPRDISTIEALSTYTISEVKSENPMEIIIRPKRSILNTPNNIKLQNIDELVNSGIALLEKDVEETGTKLNLGVFEVEIPSFLIASVEAFQNSKQEFNSGLSNGRNIYSLSLGGLSFYRSKKEE